MYDLDEHHALKARLRGLMNVETDPARRETLKQALSLIDAQHAHIELLREVKDGYYTAMAGWRESAQTGKPFVHVAPPAPRRASA